jgi:hypothetical protein
MHNAPCVTARAHLESRKVVRRDSAGGRRAEEREVGRAGSCGPQEGPPKPGIIARRVQTRAKVAGGVGGLAARGGVVRSRSPGTIPGARRPPSKAEVRPLFNPRGPEDDSAFPGSRGLNERRGSRSSVSPSLLAPPRPSSPHQGPSRRAASAAHQRGRGYLPLAGHSSSKL